MALTPSSVTRTDDTSGDLFLTFDTPGGDRAQGVALVDGNGAPIGYSGAPLTAAIAGTVSVDIVALTAPNPIPVSFSAGTIVNFHSGGADVASFVVQAAAGSLQELRVVLNPTVAAVRYLMLFDAVSLPANGSTPVWQALVPPAGESSESLVNGLAYASGMTVAISTTHDTLTVAVSGEGIIFGQRI